MKYIIISARQRLFANLTASIAVFGYCLSLILTPAIADAQSANEKKDATYRIGFHLWKPGKIYDEAMAGIEDGLALEGIVYEKVVLQSHRDKSMAEKNLRTLDSMGLNLIFSLSSAGTKIANTIGMQTPVIATVVNHPTSLGVNQKNAKSPTNLTGTSYYVDTTKQMQFYQSLFPKLTKIGMIYDKNNPAGALAEEPFMRHTCQQFHLEFLSVRVENEGEIAEATTELINADVNIIVIPTNRLVYKSVQVIFDLAREHNIPVVSMNKQGVEYGALAGLFADTYKLGRYTTPMAKQILNAKNGAKHLPFTFIPKPDIIVNLKAAKALNYEFPADILGKAAIVLQ